MRGCLIVLALAVVLGGIIPSGYAVDTVQAKAGPAQIVDAGNKFCPVSGDPVSGNDFVECQGKRYGLCCSMCAATFYKNPEMYIAKMAKQEAATGTAAQAK